jgi:hypothetical protein
MDARPAFSIIERFKATAELPAFHAAWARLVVDQNSGDMARRLLGDSSFRPDAVRAEGPAALYRLRKLAGIEISNAEILQAVEEAVANQAFGRLRDLAEFMHEEGLSSEFHALVGGRIPKQFYDEMSTPKRLRRTRLIEQRS